MVFGEPSVVMVSSRMMLTSSVECLDSTFRKCFFYCNWRHNLNYSFFNKAIYIDK